MNWVELIRLLGSNNGVETCSRSIRSQCQIIIGRSYLLQRNFLNAEFICEVGIAMNNGSLSVGTLKVDRIRCKSTKEGD